MAWIVGGGVPAAVGAAIEMANACCCTGCAKFSCIRAACNENSDSFALVADNCEQAGRIPLLSIQVTLKVRGNCVSCLSLFL